MITEATLETVLKYMPSSQRDCFIKGLKGEEHKYFEDIANKLAQTIESAPKIYETDGLNETTIKPVLHYFYGNMDLYITEIDTSGINQHFGYTSLGMGYFEGGNVYLDCIFKELPLINLDFHFEPKTLAEYRKEYEE